MHRAADEIAICIDKACTAKHDKCTIGISDDADKGRAVIIRKQGSGFACPGRRCPVGGKRQRKAVG